jgi:homoserine kinase
MNILRLRLPATSANLGPGFDALGLAMSLYLEIDATESATFSIHASGRDAEQVGSLERNLLLDTYRSVAPSGPALSLTVRNEIPLGMGCGSSAAALLAGVMLANHFGGLGWTGHRMLTEACRREGHPDNVAACFHGGLTASAMSSAGEVETATFGLTGDATLPWRLLLAVPDASLSTEKARAMLPETYSRADAVSNIQATALLVAAFAQNKPELLRAGTADRIHQPYRTDACPLLPRLLPLAGMAGIHSVTLSGAGPSVLLITSQTIPLAELSSLIRRAARSSDMTIFEAEIARGASSAS